MAHGVVQYCSMKVSERSQVQHGMRWQ